MVMTRSMRKKLDADNNNDNDDSILMSVKRRRLSINSCKSVSIEYDGTRGTTARRCSFKHKKRLLHLPDELLYLIFLKLPIMDVASVISVVCKRFQSIAVNIMNIKFYNIHTQIERLRANRIQNVTTNPLSAKAAEDNVIFTYKMLSVLDIIHNEYEILKASIWRYAFFQLAPRENYLAIRAALLIDHFEVLFKHLNGSEVLLNFLTEIPNSIAILKDLAREYLDKFEKYISHTSQNTPDKCGAKIIDLLDCLNGVHRQVVCQSCRNNICHLTITYNLERAWFTVLNVNPNSNAPNKMHDEINEDLRFMHKRLRRLVGAHNSVYFEEAISYYKNSPFTIESLHPKFEMYCGYGEMCNKFYFYGTMTEGYMAQRLVAGVNVHGYNDDFDEDDYDYDVNDDINDNPFLLEVITPPATAAAADQNQMTKPLLTFEVNVTCPLYLAPWCVLTKYNTSGDLNMLNVVKAIQKSILDCHPTKQRQQQQDQQQGNDYNNNNNFDMTLTITSNSAKENRLPFKYKYCILQKSPQLITITGEDITSNS